MVIILDNIRSVHNVGSIFRTADAAGVEKIYLCGITPEPVDRFGRPLEQFVKVSLGAEKTVEWQKIKVISKLIDKLKKENYKIFAVEQSKKSIPFYTPNPKPHTLKKTTLVFGNEVKGISPAILKKADKILEIPMSGRKESLNVAVAFGIVVFGILYK
ncbi:MAG: TrmH family RNA methyltransferase [Candidatus Harrisonbacteria bacterium]|nr:TrmH family RNA methyltransferase [Candidatus Harrisonbacteria bacterium]